MVPGDALFVRMGGGTCSASLRSTSPTRSEAFQRELRDVAGTNASVLRGYPTTHPGAPLRPCERRVPRAAPPLSAAGALPVFVRHLRGRVRGLGGRGTPASVGDEDGRRRLGADPGPSGLAVTATLPGPWPGRKGDPRLLPRGLAFSLNVRRGENYDSLKLTVRATTATGTVQQRASRPVLTRSPRRRPERLPLRTFTSVTRPSGLMTASRTTTPPT